MQKTILICLLAMLIPVAVYAVANDPPQVGDSSILEFTTSVNNATWTVTAQKDGATFSNLSTTAFVNMSAFAPGKTRVTVKWKQAGHYLVKGVPSTGYNQYYAEEVQQSGGSPVTVAVVNDKTGYVLSQSFPANFASLSITGGGAVTAGTGDAYALLNTKIPTSLSFTGSYVQAQVKGQDNIDFGALQKTSLNAATPASVQNIAAQTGDAYARIGAAGAGLTNLGDARLAHLDADISSRFPTSGYTAPLTSSQTINAIWDAVLSDHTTSGTAGAALFSASTGGVDYDTLTAALYNATAANYNTLGTMGAMINAGGNVWNIAIPGSFPVGTAGYIIGNTPQPLSGSQVAAAVWTAQMVNYLTSGSTGASLNAAGSAGDPWTTPLPGAYGQGTAGWFIGNNLPGIKLKTDKLPDYWNQ